MASPPGFPRSLLTETWSPRLAHFQRYTVAHPRLIEAKEKLVAAIQNSEPNSLVFVFGPTGVVLRWSAPAFQQLRLFGVHFYCGFAL